MEDTKLVTVEITHPLWVASILHDWEDFEAKFPGDEAFSNYAGQKIGAVAGTLLRASHSHVLVLFEGMVKAGLAKEVIGQKLEAAVAGEQIEVT